MEADFSGYATKNGLKCSDGRTIMPGAFKHADKQKVPLVWQHQHNDAGNVLGHALLENRVDGVYAFGFFNDTPSGQNAKMLVKHGDINAMSIYANNLSERGKNVLHGDIKEVSLVLSGANPGALIDNINIQHGDDITTLDDEAVIYTGLEIENTDVREDSVTHDNTSTDKAEAVVQHEEAKDDKKDDKKNDEKTVKDVFDGMTDEQKNVVYFMIGSALEGESDDDAEHSDITHSQEGTAMTRNVFEQNASTRQERPTLSHDQLQEIVTDAKRMGSFRDSFLAHAVDYGIDNLELLFPDAKAIDSSPELVGRRMEWVKQVLGGTKHSPFSKIKSLSADITTDEARAKGYIKGNQKKEEVFALLRRTTSPATIYKKQKLDRDDIIDITDLDVVAWLKAEMRIMLEEELARAILVGDGRSALDEDKVKDPAGSIDGTGIRSIANDDEFYAHRLELAANVSPKDAVKGLIRARTFYRGTGKPTLFMSDSFLTEIMLEEDKFGRALYETEQALADKLRVSSIVTVDLFDESTELLGIMVNLADYTVGSSKGGEVNMFDDFDIDFNQYKYLIETRLSGALTKYKSAIVVKRQQGTAATPDAPSFDGGTNTITVPTTTGVTYLVNGEPVTGDVEITEDTTVNAVADEGYYVPNGTTDSWSFTFTG